MTPYDAPVAEFLGRHRLTGDAAAGIMASQRLEHLLGGRARGGISWVSRPFSNGRFRRIATNQFERPSRRIATPLPCAPCGGSRLRAEALAVRLGGRSIAELTSLALSDLSSFFQSLRIEPAFDEVGSPLVAEILTRVRYLLEVGLEYLSLGRGSDTLSGGELQRARLAAQLGSGLMGVCTILDEPTAGLHTRDTERLIASIRHLLSQGNSLLVVEHDASMIRAADWVVDLGPGAGPDGGTVVAAGTPEALRNSKTSITARYLERRSAARRRAEPAPRRQSRLDRDSRGNPS